MLIVSARYTVFRVLEEWIESLSTFSTNSMCAGVTEFRAFFTVFIVSRIHEESSWTVLNTLVIEDIESFITVIAFVDVCR